MEFKHFSHPHALSFHQTPETTEPFIYTRPFQKLSTTYDSYENGPEQKHTEAQHIPPYTSEPYPSNHLHPFILEAINHESKDGNPNPPHILPSEPPPNVNVQMAAHTEPESYQQTHGQQTTTSTNQSVPEAAVRKKSAHGPQKQPVPNKDLQNSNLQADSPQPQYLKHFSHRHALRLSEVEDDDDDILCNGCEQHLSGSARCCTKPKCDFHLHKSCFELPRKIPHKSHPEHSLVLLPSPPYKKTGEFTCDACSLTGTAFDYHCKICQFDLHVKCTTLPENVKREDHEHPLKLVFSFSYKKGEGNNNDFTFYCDVCQDVVEEGYWVYYCQECDFGTHLDCVMADREDSDEETEQLSEANSLHSAQMKIQQLQFQMRMNQRMSQMKITMGQSLAKLF